MVLPNLLKEKWKSLDISRMDHDFAGPYADRNGMWKIDQNGPAKALPRP
jgi:hypothetical protein